MSTTKILNIALVVVILIAVAWGISLVRVPQPAPSVGQEQHILAGQRTAAGYHYVDDQQYYTVDVTYPATTTLSGTADQKARLTMEQGLAQEITQFKSDSGLDSLTPEDIQIQGLGGDRKYALQAIYQEFPSAHYDSYLFSIYEDTMGAHPNGYFMTFVFDKDGNQVGLNDLFVATSTNPQSDYLKQLSTLATAQVEAELSQRLGGDSTGAFFADGLAPSADNFQNFVIDGDNLHLFFPPYQVAAYAAGTFDVTIPLSSLSAVLKSGVR